MDNLIDAVGRIEGHHQVVERIAVEADRRRFVDARADQVAIVFTEIVQRVTNVLLAVDVAADRLDSGHRQKGLRTEIVD